MLYAFNRHHVSSQARGGQHRVWGVVIALLMIAGLAGSSMATESVPGFKTESEISPLRLEAGINAPCGQVLAWTPELDRAQMAEGYDYVVAGTIYRWGEEPGGAVWYDDSGRLSIDIHVPCEIAGTLRLYVCDFTNEGRIEQIEVNERFVTEVADSREGLWIEVPITACDTADGIISLLVRRIAGPNPVVQAIEFVPAPLDVAAGSAAPIGQVLDWEARYDQVLQLQEGYGYSVEGTIYRWNDTTAVWYSDDELKLHVDIPEGATGILGLYLEAGGRDQTISLEGATFGRFSDFGHGTWVFLPITAEESADGVIDVSVRLNGGANAVVNRLQFLPGLPPPPPSGPQEVTIRAGAKAEVGGPVAWSSALDEAEMLSGYGYQLLLGEVLKLADERSAWVEQDTIQLQLRIPEGQQGTLWLYMEDFDDASRAQMISVQGTCRAQVENFSTGLWIGVPIGVKEAEIGAIGVAVTAMEGPDALLSEVRFVPERDETE